jgi:Photosynthesis affected mutant 68
MTPVNFNWTLFRSAHLGFAMMLTGVGVIAAFAVIISIGDTAKAFHLMPQRPVIRTVAGAKKKGFANDKVSKGTPSSIPTAPRISEESLPIEKVERSPRPDESSLNAGQRALQELRRQRAEEKDQELRQVRDMLQADQQVQSGGPATIPEKVAQRMGLRMLPFVGVPFFGGMGTFITFWYLSTYKNYEFEPSLVAASTIGLLVIGLLVSRVCNSESSIEIICI